MQVGDEELTEYRSGHGCDTQVASRNFEKNKLQAIKNNGQTKKTIEASQLLTPLCYSARVGNITVGGLAMVIPPPSSSTEIKKKKVLRWTSTLRTKNCFDKYVEQMEM